MIEKGYLSFEEKLNQIRSECKDKVSLGKRFEELVLLLLSSNYYKNRFKLVQLWDEWSKTSGTGRPDEGIDLMATNQDGSFTAIQCKCYDADYYITYDKIDTFLSLSKELKIQNKILIHTAKEFDQGDMIKLKSLNVEVIDRKILSEYSWPKNI